MRVFVTGGSGGIGSRFVLKLVNEGHGVVYSYLNNDVKLDGATGVRLDITNKAEVSNAIKEANPDIIIHTAATQSADLCETNHEIADEINVNGTQNVLDACRAVGAKIIFTSSCFVFDGRKDIFTETDNTNPINYYGKTKLEAERTIENSGVSFIIARADQLYSWVQESQRTNTVVRTINNIRFGKECREPTDWLNCPTFSDNCADVIWALLEKGCQGTYNTVGSDFLSRFEWAQRVADVFELDKSFITPVSADEFGLPAKRPNARLDNSKAEQDSGIRLVGVEEGARLMKEN